MSIELEEIKEDNKNKHLISVGDICISDYYGTGYVESVEYDEDVWYPILVKFIQKFYLFGEIETKYLHIHFNSKGYDQPDNVKYPVKFYKEIELCQK